MGKILSLPPEQDCQHKQWYIEDSSQECHHWLFLGHLLQKKKKANHKQRSFTNQNLQSCHNDQLMEKYQYNCKR